jgi:hypothetical protein
MEAVAACGGRAAKAAPGAFYSFRFVIASGSAGR